MARLLPSVLVFLVAVSNCLAHDTWLSPSTYSAKPGQPIKFDLTSGMEFPKLDSAVKRNRVAKMGARIAGSDTKLSKFKDGGDTFRLQQSFKKEGVATVWVQLQAKEIELSDDDVAHYLEEAHAPDEVQRAWAAQKGREKWKELYTKCAKTCLTVGKADEDRSWAEPVGMVLEFLPLADPTNLRRGQPAKFTLLRNGQPLANAAVALHSKGDAGPRFETTDAQGVVTFTFDKPGPTMLATVYLQPPASGKPWESEFSTLTFDVKPE
jgi:cobalt/nickel transport protein